MNIKYTLFLSISLFALSLGLLTGCHAPLQSISDSDAIATGYAIWQQTITPNQEEIDSVILEHTPIPTQDSEPFVPEDEAEKPVKLFLHPGLPESLISDLNLTAAYEVSNQDDADTAVLIDKINPNTSRTSSATWVYALVAPFYTIEDEVSLEALSSFWRGRQNHGLPFSRLMLTPESFAVLEVLFGTPDETMIEFVAEEDLFSFSLTQERVLSVMPFNELVPHWKVLRIDGQSPIDPMFSPSAYPLSIEVWVEGIYQEVFIADNFEPEKQTVLIMTGVTAMTRATAHRMETFGNQFPGRDVQQWFTAADLVHISNEVPFAANCPYPNPFQSDLLFCSSPDRIELLEFIGTNIIELSGNHLLDYGIPAMNLTLQMYEERGWKTFAGGWDLTASRTPALLTHNGNQLAFIGCNPAGPPNAWATVASPGSTPCGDYNWLIDEIRFLSASGYLPIVTFQYNEDYTAYPDPPMVAHFQRFAEAGAVMVSGSQAHTPKTMVFHRGSFIHYGLGNLFFDQMEVYYNGFLMQGTREAFLDRMIFYDGRLISIELLTTMLEDYARPRPMTSTERAQLLTRIFTIAAKSYD